MNRTETEEKATAAASRKRNGQKNHERRANRFIAGISRVSVSSMTNKWPERRRDEIHSQ